MTTTITVKGQVTLPKKGPPRPIRMAVKKNGVFTPLNYN